MHDVVIENETIRPATPEGDAFYGLEMGTNGTGAITRRLLVGPPGARWLRHNGRHAIGPTLIPTTRSNFASNPWDGRP